MKKLFIGILVAAFVCFIIFRIVLPFSHVFTNQGVQLNTVDAYYMVRYAEIYPNYPEVDYYMSYPQGASTAEYIYPAILSIAAVMLKISPLMAAAIIPPILFILTMPGVYLCAHSLFQNKMIAATSVLMATIMPGEYMHRTMLGAGDRHALEILFITWFMALVFMMIRQVMNKGSLVDWKALAYLAGVSVLGLLFITAWRGGLITYIVLLATLYIYLATKSWRKWQFWAITGFLGIMVIGIAADIHYISSTLDFTRDAREAQPLFFTQGQFDMTYMAMWYGICLFIFMIGTGILIYKYQKYQQADYLVFITWGIILVILTMLARRWGYLLAVNISIMVAYMIWILLPLVGRRSLYRYLAVVAAIIMFPLVFNATSVAAGDQGYMPEEWQECCAFMAELSGQDNTQQYITGQVDAVAQGVLCEWSYGYWVVQQGRMPAYATPGNHYTWLPDDQLDQYKIRYIVTDNISYNYPIVWGSQEGLRMYDRL